MQGQEKMPMPSPLLTDSILTYNTSEEYLNQFRKRLLEDREEIYTTITSSFGDALCVHISLNVTGHEEFRRHPIFRLVHSAVCFRYLVRAERLLSGRMNIDLRDESVQKIKLYRIIIRESTSGYHLFLFFSPRSSVAGSTHQSQHNLPDELNLLGQRLKTLGKEIEEEAQGRLIDIDVYVYGKKISRGFQRRCMLCERSAAECRREGNHSLADVMKYCIACAEHFVSTERILYDMYFFLKGMVLYFLNASSKTGKEKEIVFFEEEGSISPDSSSSPPLFQSLTRSGYDFQADSPRLSSEVLTSLIEDALLEELNLEDKPGLVCPDSKGCHSDIDFIKMQSSASAIAPFIALAASAGGVCSAEKPSYNQVVSQSCRARLLSIHFPDGKSLTDIFSPYLDNYHYSPVYSASGTATHISSGTASMGTSQERHYQDENTWEEGYKYILMLAAVRSSGLWAEKKMFETTGGLNTHKGAVFVLGVVASALEYSLAQIMRQVDITDAGRILEEACEIVKKMCKGIVSRELGGATLQHGLNVKNNNSGEKLQEPGASSTSSLTSSRYLTHGEKLYLKYGFTGVRGEAEEGFQTVFRAAIPVLYSLAFSYNKAADMSERSLTEIKCGESGVIPTLSFFVPHLKYPELLKLLLLYIMGRVQDSNVFWRGGPEVYSEWKRKADEKLQLFLKIISEISQKIKADSKQIIKDCVKETPAKMLSEALNELHHFALQHNISPGGAADMLSASIYAAKRIALMLNIRKI